MHRIVAAALLGMVTFAGTAVAMCTLEGEVVSAGQGLGGVSVRTRQGVNLVDIATTDGDGRFSATVDALTVNTVLLLVYAKPEFAEVKLSLNADPATRCPVMPHRQVALEPIAGATAGAIAGPISRTVFVSPYAMFGNVDDAAVDGFNGMVDDIIGHRIRAFRTKLKLTPPPPEISVRMLDETLSMVDRERIRAVGSENHALAIITGEGELRQTELGTDVFDLSSDFSVIARHPRYAELRMEIVDTLPQESARPSRLSGHLDEFWGRKAMIALGVRELALLPQPAPREKLLAIGDLLIRVRSTMGEDDPLIEEIQQLISYVEEELQR